MNLNMTLLGQVLTFLIFIWTCYKYVWPPIMNALRERQSTIVSGLQSAERAERDLAQAEERASEQLQTAREEARQIIEQARGRASQIIEEARDDARREGERQKETATAEIEQEMNRAREELRAQVATLAITGAERVLESSVDEERHRQMLRRLAAEL